MNVSSASSIPAARPVASARAADGDFKTKGVGHEVKDADGDYKQTKAVPPAVQTTSTAVAAASSSNAVRGALIDLPKGGA